MSFDLLGADSSLDQSPNDVQRSARIAFESGLRYGLGMPQPKSNEIGFKSGETMGSKAKDEKRILELMIQSATSKLRDIDTNIISSYEDGWRAAFAGETIPPAKVSGTKQDWTELARYSGFVDCDTYISTKTRPRKIAIVGCTVAAGLAFGSYLLITRRK